MNYEKFTIIVFRHCRDSLGNFMNITSRFELINNLNDTVLAKGTDYSTIRAKFLIPRLYMKRILHYSGIVLTIQE